MGQHGRDVSGGLSEQIAGAVGWLARKRSVPRDVAEEAVQEALLQLVQLTSAGRPSDLDGWLRRIAERRLIDIERHRRTQVPGSDDAKVRDLPLSSPDLDTLIALRSSLQALSPDQRTLVVLRLSGIGWREIAEWTGLGTEVVRKRFELALVELQRLMRGDTET